MNENVNVMNELDKCKLVIQDTINSSNLKVNCDEILIRIHKLIDVDKFNYWLQHNLDTFKSKSNQASYFKKSFFNELEKGTFEITKVRYIPNCQPLINQLRDKGIVILADDSAYLNVLWEELLNRYQVPMEVALNLNGQIVDFIAGTDNKSFEEYKRLIKECKTLKSYNIDWVAIEVKVASFITEWDTLLDELESAYD